MPIDDWRKIFDHRLIMLTNKERMYFALSAISPDWDTVNYYSKTNLWHTKVTAFFEGNIIVKVISETKRVLNDGVSNYESYVEYDTTLATANRKELLPLTSRGKPKPLSAASINAVTPFGCRLTITYETGKDTLLWLSNPRANKEFPVGEWTAISTIRSDNDFHAFMDNYIASCREDYFEKLQSFKSAKKVTIKYKPGDIFRMELDLTHYCYGIITGDIKQIKSMPELPERHSLRQLMMVPIMIRPYQLITDNPNLSAADLCSIPLGRVEICADNDIIWGKHTIVDHKQLAPEDIEFNFVCTKIISHSPHATLFTQDHFMHDGIIPKQEFTLYIEWGFAQTSLRYDQLSEKLKEYLLNYSSPHGGISMSIDPHFAVPDEMRRKYYSYRENLLNPENRKILTEIFACLEMEADTTFDEFAEKFNGLSLLEISSQMTK